MQKIAFNIYFTLIISILAFSPSLAQVSLSVDVGPQIPNGDWSSRYNTGVGTNIKLKYMVDDFAIGVRTGFNSFKLDNSENIQYRIVPITFDFSYYFTGSKVIPYLEGGFGAYINSYKVRDFSSRDSNRFGAHLGGGIWFDVAEAVDLGGGVQFNFLENTSYMGLNFGVKFDF